MQVWTNRWPGKCSNRSCPNGQNRFNGVMEGAGFTTRENGQYSTWCKTCCPVKIEASSSTPQARKLRADGKVVIGYEPDNMPLLRSLPGYKNVKDGNGQWQMSCSVTQADLPRVLEIADKLGLDVAPELRTACVQTEQAAAVALDPRLYPFQVKGVDHVSRRTHAFLGHEPGLGKTAMSLCSLPQDGSAAVLVICPNSLKHNWCKETKMWSPIYKPEVLSGKDGFRWPAKGELLTINFDILPDVETVPEGITVIVDEVTACKNWKAKRTQRVQKICEGAAKVIALSGTPLMNRPFDLWGVLNATGMAKEVFGGWNTFIRLFGGEKDRWGGWTFTKPGPEVAERLRRVMIRRLRADVLPDLPPKTYSELVVNGVPAALAKQLDKLQEEWEDVLDMDELPPFEAFSKCRAILAESRIPAMLEQVESFEESETPLVVFSAYRAPIDELNGRDGWKVITGDTKPQDRQTIVDDFQAGKLKGVGLTIAAGGVGLTLTKAAHVLFTDLDWTPASNSQAEDRAVRIGQTAANVQIIRMVSDHPLDQHVQRLLIGKIAMAKAAIDAEAKALVPAPATPVKVEGETEEAFTARMKVVQDAREKVAREAAERQARVEQDAKDREARQVAEKVQQIATRQRGKVGDWLDQPITPELDATIRNAFARMCQDDPDFAQEKNGVGFTKGDSCLARWIGAGLGSGDAKVQETAARGLLGLLQKYAKTQLRAFPQLFPKK